MILISASLPVFRPVTPPASPRNNPVPRINDSVPRNNYSVPRNIYQPPSHRENVTTSAPVAQSSDVRVRRAAYVYK